MTFDNQRLANDTTELGISTFAETTPDPRTGWTVNTAADRPVPRALLNGTVDEGRKTLRGYIRHPETDLEHLDALHRRRVGQLEPPRRGRATIQR